MCYVRMPNIKPWLLIDPQDNFKLELLTTNNNKGFGEKEKRGESLALLSFISLTSSFLSALRLPCVLCCAALVLSVCSFDNIHMLTPPNVCLRLIPVSVSTKSVLTFRWGVPPCASHVSLPCSHCSAIISFIILKAKTNELEFDKGLGLMLLVVEGYERQ